MQLTNLQRSSSSTPAVPSAHEHQDTQSTSKVCPLVPRATQSFRFLHRPQPLDGRLVLRHRRPLTQPYPNAYSHPLPRFRYNGTTGLLTVDFECDPAFAGGTNWRAKTFYVTAIPRRRPRTIFDGASDVFTSAFRHPFSLLVGAHASAPETTAAGTDDTFNLREDEVEEQERGEETEVDDDPARDRAVRVIGMTPEQDHELTERAWARRRWEVIPLRATAARNSGLW